MIAVLVAAGALQLEPSAFATACMAGGGAPGRVEASSDREVGRSIPIASGTEPITVMVTVNRISRGERVSIWIEEHHALPVRAGASVIATGRRIAFGSNEYQSFDYCLRLQER